MVRAFLRLFAVYFYYQVPSGSGWLVGWAWIIVPTWCNGATICDIQLERDYYNQRVSERCTILMRGVYLISNTVTSSLITFNDFQQTWNRLLSAQNSCNTIEQMYRNCALSRQMKTICTKIPQPPHYSSRSPERSVSDARYATEKSRSFNFKWHLLSGSGFYLHDCRHDRSQRAAVGKWRA